jgi:hypothetical protein
MHSILRDSRGRLRFVEFGQLGIEIRERVLEDQEMPRIPAPLDVMKDARTREQQAFASALAFDLFRREVFPRRGSAVRGERFDLTFDRLTLPTTCHYFIVASGHG